MIECMVTVGSHNQSFHRLIDYCARFSAQYRDSVHFAFQYGHSNITDINFCVNDHVFDFLGRKDFAALLKTVDCVITHAGVGTLNEATDFGFFPIIVPRLVEANEHTDPSQLPVCTYFSDISRGFCVNPLPSFTDFFDLIKAATALRRAPRKSKCWYYFQESIKADVLNWKILS